MLRVRLDELITPALVTAFQQQWSTSAEVALAQADEALRLLTAPRDEVERSIADLVLGLVGPEPDAMAWLEAMTRGSWEISDAVSVTIARVRQSPAQSIKRQQERIAALAAHDRTDTNRAAIENAYKDALRLLVASSLLTRMRQGIAAKAALGAGWALMVAVTDHCDLEDKRALYWLGGDTNLQAALGQAVRDVLARFECAYPASGTPTRAMIANELPPGVDPYAFFARKSDDFQVALTRRPKLPFVAPDFIRAPTKQEEEQARYRAALLMPSLHGWTADPSKERAVTFALALRSEYRRKERWRYSKSEDTGLDYREWNLQTAIWRHLRSGLFFPPNLPAEHVGRFEEDLAWFYQQRGRRWVGYPRWRDAGYLHFESDPMKVHKIHI